MWRDFFQKIERRFKKPKPLATSEDLTKVLLELFRGHDLVCTLKNGWVATDSGRIAIQGRVFVSQVTDKFTSVQLDFEVKGLADKPILESCAGWGPSLHEAISSGILNFCNGSFHVFVSAITGEGCSHCEIVEWNISGIPRRVFLGPVVQAGTLPEAPFLKGQWFLEMERRIQEIQIGGAMHWIRIYHGELPQGKRWDEVLLDNETDVELQQHLAALQWPAAEQFYSLRNFLIITDLEKSAG